jgi:Flp pilus assembly protein CpaB
MLRHPSRAVALRFSAVAVVLVTAGLVASDLATLHRRAQDFGPEQGVVVARRDLSVGTTIDAGDVRIRQVHASQLPPGVLDDAKQAIGRVVQVPVLTGAFVADRNLARRRRTGLDGAIPKGMRALRIVVSDAVQPRIGAAVDILASYEVDVFSLSEASESSDVGEGSATVVAAGVVVLAVDAATSADGGPARGVTLLVTPRQARDLVFATTHGYVTLSLVPPENAR